MLPPTLFTVVCNTLYQSVLLPMDAFLLSFLESSLQLFFNAIRPSFEDFFFLWVFYHSAYIDGSRLVKDSKENLQIAQVGTADITFSDRLICQSVVIRIRSMLKFSVKLPIVPMVPLYESTESTIASWQRWLVCHFLPLSDAIFVKSNSGGGRVWGRYSDIKRQRRRRYETQLYAPMRRIHARTDDAFILRALRPGHTFSLQRSVRLSVGVDSTLYALMIDCASLARRMTQSNVVYVTSCVVLTYGRTTRFFTS